LNSVRASASFRLRTGSTRANISVISLGPGIVPRAARAGNSFDQEVAIQSAEDCYQVTRSIL